MSKFALEDSLLSIQHQLDSKEFMEYISAGEADDRVRRYKEAQRKVTEEHK